MGARPIPPREAAAAPKPALSSLRALLIALGLALLLAFALLCLRAPQALPPSPGLKAVVFAPAEALLSSLSAAQVAIPGVPPTTPATGAATAAAAAPRRGLLPYPRRAGKEHAANTSRLPSRGQGRGFLPGRHVPGALDLQVLFLSRPTPTGAQRRTVVRSTLALLDAATYTVAYYWALTPPTDAATLAAILAENATHGDIAWCNAALHDEELTNKIHDEMKAGAARGAEAGGAPFWVKLDDDVLVLWERFLPTLYAEMPREGLVWCGQGTGHAGIYCNGPYLYSMDVVARLAADEGACCGGGRIDDWWFPNIGWNSRAIWNFGADLRWHNDDEGDPAVCVCKRFTLTSDSLVVHHIHSRLVTYYMSNLTVFSLVGKPLRNYDFNVCSPGEVDNPRCNSVPHCKGAGPSPADCILNEWGTRDF